MAGIVCKLCLAKSTQALCEGVPPESTDACSYWINVDLSKNADPANPEHK